MNIRNLIGQPIVQAGLLLLAVMALYSGSLSAPFVFDDLTFFSDSGMTDSGMLSKYGEGYFSLELRWLPYASLARTVEWLGFDRSWLRLGNVLLHGANAIALLFLLRRLFRVALAGEDQQAGLSATLAWFAFFGALLFALHPVAVYGVAYLIQRSSLMATLFMLLMLLAYLKGLHPAPRPPEGRVSGGTSFAGDGSWCWMVLAALCYFAAVYSKEHSIAAPGVALAMTLLVRKPSAALFRQISPYYVLATLIAAAVVWSTVSSKAVLGSVYEPNAMGILNLSTKRQGLTDLPDVHLLSILTQCGLFFKYLWLWLAPNPAWMSVDMREPFATSLSGWYTLGLVGFLGYFCAAVWLLLKRGSRGLVGFALLYPWILFLTEFSTVRIQEPFVLYRSYLWMPGLFAALPVVFGWLVPKKAYLVLALAGVLLVPLTLNRIDTFSSALKLWDDVEKLIRGKPNVTAADRIYYNRGTELGKLQRYEDAIADFTRSIAAYPGYDFVYGDRATAYYLLGKYNHALRDYDKAIELNPDNPKSYYGRSLTHRALGDFASAQEDLMKSCALGLCP